MDKKAREQRRLRKQQFILEDMRNLSDSLSSKETLENAVKRITEAVILLLEEKK